MAKATIISVGLFMRSPMRCSAPPQRMIGIARRNSKSQLLAGFQNAGRDGGWGGGGGGRLLGGLTGEANRLDQHNQQNTYHASKKVERPQPNAK